MLVNRIPALGFVLSVNPVLRIMSVTYHDVSLVKISQKLEHLSIVIILFDRSTATFGATAERNMRAE